MASSRPRSPRTPPPHSQSHYYRPPLSPSRSSPPFSSPGTSPSRHSRRSRIQSIIASDTLLARLTPTTIRQLSHDESLGFTAAEREWSLRAAEGVGKVGEWLGEVEGWEKEWRGGEGHKEGRGFVMPERGERRRRRRRKKGDERMKTPEKRTRSPEKQTGTLGTVVEEEEGGKTPRPSKKWDLKGDYGFGGGDDSAVMTDDESETEESRPKQVKIRTFSKPIAPFLRRASGVGGKETTEEHVAFTSHHPQRRRTSSVGDNDAPKPTQERDEEEEESEEEEEEEEEEYYGSLPASLVTHYERRIAEIQHGIDALDIEGLKGKVLSYRTAAPHSLHLTSPTAVITATTLQILPPLSRLTLLLTTWSTRIAILKIVPYFLRWLESATLALESGINAIGMVGSAGKLEEEVWGLMKGAVEVKVATAGRMCDGMLDALEGREEVVPDAWIGKLEELEERFAQWCVNGERLVLEGRLREASREEEVEVARERKAREGEMREVERRAKGDEDVIGEVLERAGEVERGLMEAMEVREDIEDAISIVDSDGNSVIDTEEHGEEAVGLGINGTSCPSCRGGVEDGVIERGRRGRRSGSPDLVVGSPDLETRLRKEEAEDAEEVALSRGFSVSPTPLNKFRTTTTTVMRNGEDEKPHPSRGISTSPTPLTRSRAAIVKHVDEQNEHHHDAPFRMRKAMITGEHAHIGSPGPRSPSPALSNVSEAASERAEERRRRNSRPTTPTSHTSVCWRTSRPTTPMRPITPTPIHTAPSSSSKFGGSALGTPSPTLSAETVIVSYPHTPLQDSSPSTAPVASITPTPISAPAAEVAVKEDVPPASDDVIQKIPPPATLPKSIPSQREISPSPDPATLTSSVEISSEVVAVTPEPALAEPSSTASLEAETTTSVDPIPDSGRKKDSMTLATTSAPTPTACKAGMVEHTIPVSEPTPAQISASIEQASKVPSSIRDIAASDKQTQKSSGSLPAVESATGTALTLITVRQAEEADDQQTAKPSAQPTLDDALKSSTPVPETANALTLAIEGAVEEETPIIAFDSVVSRPTTLAISTNSSVTVTDTPTAESITPVKVPVDDRTFIESIPAAGDVTADQTEETEKEGEEVQIPELVSPEAKKLAITVVPEATSIPVEAPTSTVDGAAVDPGELILEQNTPQISDATSEKSVLTLESASKSAPEPTPGAVFVSTPPITSPTLVHIQHLDNTVSSTLSSTSDDMSFADIVDGAYPSVVESDDQVELELDVLIRPSLSQENQKESQGPDMADLSESLNVINAIADDESECDYDVENVELKHVPEELLNKEEDISLAAEPATTTITTADPPVAAAATAGIVAALALGQVSPEEVEPEKLEEVLEAANQREVSEQALEIVLETQAHRMGSGQSTIRTHDEEIPELGTVSEKERAPKVLPFAAIVRETVTTSKPVGSMTPPVEDEIKPEEPVTATVATVTLATDDNKEIMTLNEDVTETIEAALSVNDAPKEPKKVVAAVVDAKVEEVDPVVEEAQVPAEQVDVEAVVTPTMAVPVVMTAEEDKAHEAAVQETTKLQLKTTKPTFPEVGTNKDTAVSALELEATSGSGLTGSIASREVKTIALVSTIASEVVMKQEEVEPELSSIPTLTLQPASPETEYKSEIKQEEVSDEKPKSDGALDVLDREWVDNINPETSEVPIKTKDQSRIDVMIDAMISPKNEEDTKIKTEESDEDASAILRDLEGFVDVSVAKIETPPREVKAERQVIRSMLDINTPPLVKLEPETPPELEEDALLSSAASSVFSSAAPSPIPSIRRNTHCCTPSLELVEVVDDEYVPSPQRARRAANHSDNEHTLYSSSSNPDFFASSSSDEFESHHPIFDPDDLDTSVDADASFDTSFDDLVPPLPQERPIQVLPAATEQTTPPKVLTRSRRKMSVSVATELPSIREVATPKSVRVFKMSMETPVVDDDTGSGSGASGEPSPSLEGGFKLGGKVRRTSESLFGGMAKAKAKKETEAKEQTQKNSGIPVFGKRRGIPIPGPRMAMSLSSSIESSPAGSNDEDSSPTAATRRGRKLVREETPEQEVGKIVVQKRAGKSFIPTSTSTKPSGIARPASSLGVRPGSVAGNRPPSANGIRPASATGIHPPSASGICPPIASGTRLPSATGLRRPSTSGTRPPMTSGVKAPSASGIRTPSATGNRPPSATGIRPPSTTGLRPPSASGIRPPSASGIRPPSASGIRPPSASGIRPPSASGIRPPSASGIRPPSASGIRPPSASGIHPPLISGIRPPSASGIRPPSASGIRPPASYRNPTHKRAVSQTLTHPTSSSPSSPPSTTTTSAASRIRKSAAPNTPRTPQRQNIDLDEQVNTLLLSLPRKVRLTADNLSKLAAQNRHHGHGNNLDVDISSPDNLQISSGDSDTRSSVGSEARSTAARVAKRRDRKEREKQHHGDGKYYDLHRNDGQPPMKLYVRLVGNARLVCRIGGGWSDLEEYLKDWALHHGSKMRAVSHGGVERPFEITDLPIPAQQATIAARPPSRTLRSRASMAEIPKARSQTSTGYYGHRSSSSMDNSRSTSPTPDQYTRPRSSMRAPSPAFQFAMLPTGQNTRQSLPTLIRAPSRASSTTPTFSDRDYSPTTSSSSPDQSRPTSSSSSATITGMGPGLRRMTSRLSFTESADGSYAGSVSVATPAPKPLPLAGPRKKGAREGTEESRKWVEGMIGQVRKVSASQIPRSGGFCGGGGLVGEEEERMRRVAEQVERGGSRRVTIGEVFGDEEEGEEEEVEVEVMRGSGEVKRVFLRRESHGGGGMGVQGAREGRGRKGGRMSIS